MSKVSIAIGRRVYAMDCDTESSAAAIESLAKILNKKVNDVLLSLPGIDNENAIVFSALLFISELLEVKNINKDANIQLFDINEIKSLRSKIAQINRIVENIKAE